MKSPNVRTADVTPILCCTFFEAVGSPLLGPAILGDYAAIVGAPMPELDQPVEVFRDQYWAAESWSKYPFDLPGVNREGAAYEKFFEAESQCAAANGSLVEWDSRPMLDFKHLARARRLVASVLGKFRMDEVPLHCSFGPGATTSIPRRLASHQQKWQQASHITGPALPWYLAFRRYNGGWHIGDRKLEIVEGNKVTTVPKNAKTDRVIAIEPDWNMFFQRAIGTMIRLRLQRRLGLLTPDAQLRNKNAAQIGSVDGSLATIDLTSASDSVSLALCEALLPADWLSAMLQLRSERGTVGDKTVTYEKISSMGNGFTFELETLLFWALTRSICKEGTVLAYGDDIVCPSEYAPEVIFFLEQCGFRINRKKTFFDGPFRESCGGHFLKGIEVTPPYFKYPVDNLPEIVSTANRIRLFSEQSTSGYWADGRFEYIWKWLAKMVPKSLRGPRAYGDAVLHCAFDQARPRWDFDLQKWKVKALLPITEDYVENDWGGLFTSLWGRVSESSHVERRSLEWRFGAIRAFRWDEPSPWVTED